MTEHLFTPQNRSVDGVTSIALDDANVYFASAGSIHRITFADGAETTFFAATAPFPIVRSIVVDSTNAYWIQQDDAIVKMPLSGGPVTRLFEWGPFALFPTSIAQQGSDLFVADSGGGYSWSDDGQISGRGSILKLSTVAPGTPEVLAASLPFPTSIAVAADGVYFGGGQIQQSVRKWAPVQRVGSNHAVAMSTPRPSCPT